MNEEFRELDLQLGAANLEIKELQAKINEYRMFLMAVKLVAQRQRDNDDLWEVPISRQGLEAQKALREIHSVLLDGKQ